MRVVLACTVALSLAACSESSRGDVRFAPSGLVATHPATGPGTTPTGTGPGTTPTGTDGTTPTTPTTTTTGDPPNGVDVSHWNEPIDWPSVANGGYQWAYIKATEGTYYVSDVFDDEYGGSLDAGMIRGAYHFAIPDDSDGASQADYFVDHGGGWSADGATLPGALDIEWNPYWYDDCYGLSLGEMTDWVADFSNEYFDLTGRYPSVYSSKTYWNLCIDSTSFEDDPLWVANWDVAAPALPVGWGDYTFWQFGDSGNVPGISGDTDVDVFNGSPSQLYHFALGD